jgi:plasmid replication initiation protein
VAPPSRGPVSGRAQLDLFTALPESFGPQDQRDLMERPFFSLAKTPRLKPIEYAVAGVPPPHG